MIPYIPYDLVLIIMNNVYEKLSPVERLQFNCPKSHSNTQFKKPSQYEIAFEKLCNHIKNEKLWTNKGKYTLSKSRDLHQVQTSYFNNDYDVCENYNDITSMILAKTIPMSLKNALFADGMNLYAGHDDPESYLKCYSPYDRHRKYYFMVEEANRRLVSQPI